jgi:hypothetical protein
MSSLAITPKVTSDYTYTLIGSQKELQVMLLWRGQPTWYYGSARQSIALPLPGADDTVPVRAEITRGATTVRFAIYGTELEQWITEAWQSNIEPMKKVAKSLRKHQPLILNWFKAGGILSPGTVEGFNNKAKLTIKKAYGFRSVEYLKIALYHTLGDLPEPPMTHRFC